MHSIEILSAAKNLWYEATDTHRSSHVWAAHQLVVVITSSLLHLLRISQETSRYAAANFWLWRKCVAIKQASNFGNANTWSHISVMTVMWWDLCLILISFEYCCYFLLWGSCTATGPQMWGMLTSISYDRNVVRFVDNFDNLRAQLQYSGIRKLHGHYASSNVKNALVFRQDRNLVNNFWYLSSLQHVLREAAPLRGFYVTQLRND